MEIETNTLENDYKGKQMMNLVLILRGAWINMNYNLVPFKNLTFQSNKCIPIYSKEQQNKYTVHNIFTWESKWKKTTYKFSYIIKRLH
jgi:hypothetical protein